MAARGFKRFKGWDFCAKAKRKPCQADMMLCKPVVNWSTKVSPPLQLRTRETGKRGGAFFSTLVVVKREDMYM